MTKFKWQVRTSLKSDGYTLKEIKKLEQSAPEGWFTLEATTRMRKSRRAWTEEQLASGITKTQLKNIIYRFLQRGILDPWAEFREEYTGHHTKSSMKGSHFSEFLTKRRELVKVYGKRKLGVKNQYPRG